MKTSLFNGARLHYDVPTKTILEKLVDGRASMGFAPQLSPIIGNSVLLATDIMQNAKDNPSIPFANVGDCISILYASSKTFQGFLKQICRVVRSGADQIYQPTMRLKDGCQGDLLVLECSATQTTFQCWENGSDIYSEKVVDTCSFLEFISALKVHLYDHTNTRFLLINDLSVLVGGCDLWERNNALCKIAYDNKLVVLSGVKVSNDANALAEQNKYFSANERALCYLIEDEYKGTPFFRLIYGFPKLMQIIYALDEDGNTCIPAGVAKALAMEHFGKMFAHKQISYSLFANRLYGAFGTEYNYDTICTRIAEACDNGILNKSGDKNKSTLIYAGSENNKKKFVGNIALLSHAKHDQCKKLVSFMKFGETKFVFGEKTNLITWYLICTILGKHKKPFRLKTPHKNMLVVLLGDEEKGQSLKNTIKSYAGECGFSSNVDVVTIAPNIEDVAFLEKYKDLYNKFLPDFFFVLRFQDVMPKSYALIDLAKEMGIFAKRKGFALIVQDGSEDYYNNYSMYNYENEYKEEMFCFVEEVLEGLLDCTTQSGKYTAFARFDRGVRGEASAYEQKYKYYDECFCGVRFGRLEQIRDPYGKPITTSQLKTARELGIVRVDKSGYINYIPQEKR